MTTSTERNLNDAAEEDLRFVSRAFLARAQKHIIGRRDRALLFAWAQRKALDELPPEHRSAQYVTRTWEYPSFGASVREVMTYIWNTFEATRAQAVVRVIILGRAVQLALDELSPDERTSALRTVTQIVGA